MSSCVWKPTRSKASSFSNSCVWRGRHSIEAREANGVWKKNPDRLFHTALAQKVRQHQEVIVVDPQNGMYLDEAHQRLGSAAVDLDIVVEEPVLDRPSGRDGCA